MTVVHQVSNHKRHFLFHFSFQQWFQESCYVISMHDTFIRKGKVTCYQSVMDLLDHALVYILMITNLYILCVFVLMYFTVSYGGWLVSRKWAEVRKCEVSFPTSIVHPNTRKRKWINPFSFSLFPFTQSFPHFQGATVNFIVM